MRIKVTYTIEEETVKRIKQLSKETRVPQAQYVQEALEWVLNKYEKKKGGK